MGSTIKDVPEEVRMHLKSIFAALVIVAAPVYAQAQKPTRADAQKVFEIIISDKAKTEAFCEIDKLADQMVQAEQENDSKKVEELELKADELERKLGPEFGALMNGLEDMDQNSEEGQQISPILKALRTLCTR